MSAIYDFFTEKDLSSVRDLYRKIKEVLSQDNCERLFNITDAELLNLHEVLDKKFELIITDNLETDEVFKVRKQGRVLDL